MVRTVGEAWKLGWRLTVHCYWRGQHHKPGHRNDTVYCDTKTELDLRTLVWTRGAHFPIENLSSRLRCPSCYRTGVRVIFDIPNQPNHDALTG